MRIRKNVFPFRPENAGTFRDRCAFFFSTKEYVQTEDGVLFEKQNATVMYSRVGKVRAGRQ